MKKFAIVFLANKVLRLDFRLKYIVCPSKENTEVTPHKAYTLN